MDAPATPDKNTSGPWKTSINGSLSPLRHNNDWRNPDGWVHEETLPVARLAGNHHKQCEPTKSTPGATLVLSDGAVPIFPVSAIRENLGGINTRRVNTPNFAQVGCLARSDAGDQAVLASMYEDTTTKGT